MLIIYSQRLTTQLRQGTPSLINNHVIKTISEFVNNPITIIKKENDEKKEDEKICDYMVYICY